MVLMPGESMRRNTADPPSSPLPPPSPISEDVPLSPSSPEALEQSPASSPILEPPKRKRAWEVRSTSGQPSRTTRSLWRRLESEDITCQPGTSGPFHDLILPGVSDRDVIDLVDQSNIVDQCETLCSSVHDASPGTNVASTDGSSVNESSSDNISVISDGSDSVTRMDLDSSVSDEHEQMSADSDRFEGEWYDASDLVTDDSDSNSNMSDSQDVSLLYEGSDKSVDEAVLDIFSNYFQNRETQSSLSSHLDTFIKYLPKPNNMPKNVKALFKYIEQQDPSFKEHVHMYCGDCLLHFTDENCVQCEACESTMKKTFFTFSIEDQIRHFFENCSLAEEIDKVVQGRNTVQVNEDLIRDICDGSEYLRLNLSGYDLTLMWYTDGVSISRSSKTELWPLQFVICELPPHLRSSYIVVCGIWCDISKPVMNTFLAPFVDSLIDIDHKGGIMWRHPKTGIQHQSLIFAPLACADAPARASVQCIMSHNSKFACNSCEQKTAKLPLTIAEQQAREAGARIRRKRAFLFMEEAAQLRNSDRMKHQARKAFRNNTVVKGVKGPTCVEHIPRLDVATFLYAEYMHGICLGVVRHFISLWFCVAGPWNISAYCDDVDDFIQRVKPTSDISRILRCVSDFPRWKASECRQWLLFQSLPALANYLPTVYFQHWMLLVMGVFILLKDIISTTDIAAAETMLKLFVRDVGVLYRGQDYVYNVHQILHLCLYVRRWGPLWATSAFFFEGFNGILVQMIHGTKNPGKELINCLRRAHGIQMLRNRIVAHTQIHDTSTPEVLNRKRSYEFSGDEKTVLTTHGMTLCDLSVYSRVKVLRQTFTSKLYSAEKKRNNYTVCFSLAGNVKYGEILFFVLPNNAPSQDAGAYIKILKVDHSRIFYHRLSRAKVSHIVPIAASEESTVCSLHNIVCKVVRVGDFVCKLPNMYERNL